MHETYGDKVEFLVVYIREAHAMDGHLPMEFGAIEDPINDAERHLVASRCVTDLKLPMRAVVDKLDDAVNNAYRGWPERLFLIGLDGKVAYSGGPGPFEFEPGELETAIRKQLTRPTSRPTKGTGR